MYVDVVDPNQWNIDIPMDESGAIHGKRRRFRWGLSWVDPDLFLQNTHI